MKLEYGDALEQIKTILRSTEIPYFICEDCGSIVIADSKELLNRNGSCLNLDKNDHRFYNISEEILAQLKEKHRIMHSMREENNAELVRYGEALQTIIELFKGERKKGEEYEED